MTIFNPNIPEIQGGDYGRLTKPISDVAVNRTYESLFKGVGDLFTEGVKGADTLVKMDIDDTVYREANAEREAFTATLEDKLYPGASGDVPYVGGKNSPQGTGAVPNSKLSGSTTDNALLAYAQAPEEEVPAEVQTVGESVDLLQQARARGLPETYYHGRLLTLAKDIRTKYPGYRDYIDQQISSVTGVNPANAYLRDMVTMYSTALGGANKERDKSITELLKHRDLPGTPQMMQAVLQNRAGLLEVTKFQNAALSEDYELKRRASRREDKKGERAEGITMAHDDLHYEIGVEVARSWRSLELSNGLTPEKIRDIVSRRGRGEAAGIDDTEIRELGAAIEAMKLDVKTRLTANIQKSGLARDVGGLDVVNKAIDEGMKVYDMVSDAIHNKDFGQAFFHANMAKSQVEDTKYGFLNNKDYGQFFRNSAAINSMGPDFARKLFETFITSNLDVPVKSLFASSAAALTTQPDIRTRGDIKTFIDTVKEAKAAGVTSGDYFDSMIGVITLAADPTTPLQAKINYARAAFDPKNFGVLNEFKDDTWDPVKKRMVPGRQTAFQKLTTPAMTKAMWDLGQQDQTIWKNYSNWVERSFGQDLFRRDVNNLNSYQEFQRFNITWDPEKSKFKVYAHPDTQVHQRGVPPPGMIQAERTIGRINDGLAQVANVYKQEGKDINGYLLRLLIDGTGFNPRSGKSAVTLPEKMIEQLTKARIDATGGPQRATGERKSNYDLEPARNGGTLADFLKNPDGQAPLGLTQSELAAIPQKKALDDGTFGVYIKGQWYRATKVKK